MLSLMNLIHMCEMILTLAGNPVKEILLKLNLPDHRTMDMIIDQQVALDEALVPHASRQRIGKRNFHLRSDITSKESNLQVVYDVLRLTPFYKTFNELPFEEGILAFLRNLGHSGEIKKITDNVDFVYLLWEDFVYQVEHKDAKKSNEMYYPRFTKVIINFFMTKDPSIPKRNKVNWHYVRDDQMFTTIKLISRHQNTQQFGAMLLVELTNEDIRNSTAYKEYYAIALGAEPPKIKASVRKMQSSSDTTMPPPTAAGTRLSTLAKWKKLAKSSKAKDEGIGIIPGVLDVPTYESDEEISWKSSDEDDDDVDDQSDVDDNDDQEDEDEQDDDDQDDNDDDQDSNNDDDDFIHPKLTTHDEEAKDEESFDPIVQTPSHMENSDDESNNDESHGMNVGGVKGPDLEDDDEELYRDVNINLEGQDVQMTDVHTTQVLEDTHVTLTLVNPNGQQQSSSVSSQFISNMLNPSPDAGIDSLFESTPWVNVPVTNTVMPLLVSAPTLPSPSIPIISQAQQAPAPSPATALSSSLQDRQILFAEAISFIPGINDRYIDHRMYEVVKLAVQLQFDGLRDEAQAENEDFLNKLDENIQKIIKEQVKEQVKLEDEVLTRASNSSKTSYVVAADLSELELKKILIEKMESNKSIHRSYEQRNLYKALVDAYKCVKIILDTYRDTVTLKRRRDDEDKDEEPFARLERGPRRRRAGKEPESTSAPKEKASKTSSKSTEGSKSHQKTTSESAPAEELMQTTQDLEEPEHLKFEIAFLMNPFKVDTLTPELLAGPTYELMKGSCKRLVKLEFFLEKVYKPLPLIPNSRGRRVIPFDHFINNDLEYLRGGDFSQKYTTSVTKTKPADCGHIKWIEDLFYRFAANRESARDVYSKRRIIAVTELQIIEWHNYKHLDWITVRRDDDKLYKFKEGILKRLHIQDIEDMLLLLVQENLTNLTVKECFAFNVSLRIFTRSIVIQLRFINQNKDKQNRLMRIDELHKFSDDTLSDVQTALDDCLKGIQMKYLPQTIWRRSE
nr:hypothetical protein [Tanacetum cinerariifolium]